MPRKRSRLDVKIPPADLAELDRLAAELRLYRVNVAMAALRFGMARLGERLEQGMPWEDVAGRVHRVNTMKAEDLYHAAPKRGAAAAQR